MEVTKLYVGNLNYCVDEDRLQEVFSAHGTVKSVDLITDRETGRSKGFAFVQMSANNEVRDAISALNGKELEGRQLKVSQARPKTQRSGGYNKRY